jgi:drug/metabolite transporter (DMT)-like permease
MCTDSLLYLPLADATVITFLAPSLACWACSFLINEPFTRMEQIAAYVSLFGVVLIARPVSLFASMRSHSDESVPPASGDGDILPSNKTIASPDRLAADYDAVTPQQRAMAVGIAMLGVLGAAGAYTTIRWIGKRAHPLISVNYFATWCTIVSIVAMFTIPGVGFLLPRYFRDWCYLIFLGICGFVMVSCSFHARTNMANVSSNFCLLLVCSTKSRLVRQTWCTCRCCLHLLSTN